MKGIRPAGRVDWRQPSVAGQSRIGHGHSRSRIGHGSVTDQSRVSHGSVTGQSRVSHGHSQSQVSQSRSQTLKAGVFGAPAKVVLSTSCHVLHGTN